MKYEYVSTMSYKTRIAQLLAHVGLSRAGMSIYHKLTGDGPWKVSVENKIKQYNSSKEPQNGTVLFVLIPGYRDLTLRYCALAHAWAAKGYNPVFLIDDGTLPADIGITVNDTRPELSKERYRIRARGLVEKFGFTLKTVDEMLSSKDNSKMQDIIHAESMSKQTQEFEPDVQAYARASTRKYFKRYRLDFSKKEVSNAYVDFLRSGLMILFSCRKMIESNNITHMIVNETSYIQGGIPLDVGVSSHLSVYTSSTGYIDGKAMYGKGDINEPNPQFFDINLMNNVVGDVLSEKKEADIEEIMNRRQRNENTPLDYTTKDGRGIEHTGSLAVGVFSHLLWDGALEPDSGTYTDFYSWLDDTITVGSNLDDVEFILKSHPAEEIRGTNESVADWLNENYNPLPDNFTFIPADTDVDTYQLLNQLDAGIVFASTVGLEMAYDRIPIIIGGYPPYHDVGLGFTPETKPEYKRLIKNIATLECTDEMQRQAIKFSYVLFQCRNIKLPYYHELKTTQTSISIEHDEIVGNDSIYSEIVDQMIRGDDILSPECQT